MSSFNTSHVTVYREKLHNLIDTIQFQYISCYCLSCTYSYVSSRQRCFNTSHVTVYPSSPSLSRLLYVRFNTSHVTVYRVADALALGRDKFQYISCYCLSSRNRRICKRFKVSIHLMLLFIMVRHIRCNADFEFQYISCYCLSNEFTPLYIFLRIKNPLFSSFS